MVLTEGARGRCLQFYATASFPEIQSWLTCEKFGSDINHVFEQFMVTKY
jgi:hypothetical protein